MKKGNQMLTKITAFRKRKRSSPDSEAPVIGQYLVGLGAAEPHQDPLRTDRLQAPLAKPNPDTKSKKSSEFKEFKLQFQRALNLFQEKIPNNIPQLLATKFFANLNFLGNKLENLDTKSTTIDEDMELIKSELWKLAMEIGMEIHNVLQSQEHHWSNPAQGSSVMPDLRMKLRAKIRTNESQDYPDHVKDLLFRFKDFLVQSEQKSTKEAGKLIAELHAIGLELSNPGKLSREQTEWIQELLDFTGKDFMLEEHLRPEDGQRK